MTVVGHPAHGFLPVSALFFAHVFVALLPGIAVWYVTSMPLLSILVFVVAALLLAPPLLPWYRRLQPRQPSVEEDR